MARHGDLCSRFLQWALTFNFNRTSKCQPSKEEAPQMLNGSQKSVIAPESDPCKWVAVAHYQLCVWRQKTLIHLKKVWALTYYLVRSKSLSLSVLLFELVLRCFNHLKITRRPSNYWKRVQSGASTSATVFSLNDTLTEMHQCSGNKRFSLCMLCSYMALFVHESLHMVYLNMHFILRQGCVIYMGKVCCSHTDSAF